MSPRKPRRREDAVNSVWIVERLAPSGRWHPTVGGALERVSARQEIRDWRVRNPTDRFRLVRYVAARKQEAKP